MTSLIRNVATLVVALQILISGDVTTTASPVGEIFPVGSSRAPAELFESESIQLTEESLARASISLGQDLSIFGFPGDGASKRAEPKCKAFPGDPEWASGQVWGLLSSLVGGSLHRPAPLAAACYKSSEWNVFSESQCLDVAGNWSLSTLHMEHPTSVMWPLSQGCSCLPTTNSSSSATCSLGGYPEYAVEATTVAQVQLAVNFARNNNIRLVIKNTGHDFGGKSSGAGALSIWTHRFKDIKFYDNYQTTGYQGPAFKLGSGVQAWEMYEAANKYGVVAVGGEGRTVGVMGGYIAAGGHSPLSSMYGMAADHALSMEVVLANGTFTTASADSNPDLFWALRGGGGSTYGVVTSVVIKAYPKINRLTIVKLSLDTKTLGAEKFWAAMYDYWRHFPTWAKKRHYHYWFLFNNDGVITFQLNPAHIPGSARDEVLADMKPWFDRLKELDIQVTPNVTEYTNFLDMWSDNFPLERVGIAVVKTSSRLFPATNWDSEATFLATADALRWVSETKARTIIGYCIAGKGPTGVYPDNAVNPAWRATLMHAITAAAWDPDTPLAERSAASWELTHVITQRWRDVSPGAGAYMNEADTSEPDFQQSFYGTDKYPRLYALKQALDPLGVFYAHTAVGSEDWYVTGQDPNIPTQNGKLCRK